VATLGILGRSASPEEPRVRRSPSAARAAALPLVVVFLLSACGSTASAPPSRSPAAGQASHGPAGSGAAGGGSAKPSGGPAKSAKPSGGPVAAAFHLGSPAFGQNKAIPNQFTCHGADTSPALTWSGAPAATKALVLLVVDPDANDFVHWSVLDLKPTTTGLPRGVGPTADSLQQGRNDFGKVGYGGPCPPSGTHHYRFTLSALSAPLGLGGHPTGAMVRKALASAKVLARATLIGTSKA
jgi:Raf kinase inhibitor-like YbhB/YbcL family protein